MALGLAGHHGARALSRVEAEHRTEQEHATTQAHSMVVPIVLIAHQADKHATPTIVQVSSQKVLRSPNSSNSAHPNSLYAGTRKYVSNNSCVIH